MDSVERSVLAARKALVQILGFDAGYLEMVATDEFRFHYMPSYLAQHKLPLSLTMPLREAPYISQTIHPFFDNLLFEGEQLRLAEKKYSLTRRSHGDRFKLLLLTGQYNTSAASIYPLVGEKPLDLTTTSQLGFSTNHYAMHTPYENACCVCLEPPGPHKACLSALWGSQKPQLLEAFEQDPSNIFRTVVPGQSASGAQRKSLFSQTPEGVLKKIGRPTHIIKPEGDFVEMPANEHLTMCIAKKLGFEVPPVGLYRVDGIGSVYVTKLFDRKMVVEDFAQLAEELAENKDQASMEAVADIIERFASSPQIENAEFFKRLLFCFVTGNGDMHLKNWSLSIQSQTGLIKLAPLYDYLNVRASFPQEGVEMVLPLMGKQNHLARKDFVEFAEKTLHLRTAFINKTLALLPHWYSTITQFCDRSALTPELKTRFLSIVQDRFARMQE